MRRFIIAGAPGAGKTAIIRQLELDGFSVVEEAATDVITAAHGQGKIDSWRDPHSSMPSLICNGTVRFEHLINPMRFSFMTVALSVPRHWQSTLATLFLLF